MKLDEIIRNIEKYGGLCGEFSVMEVCGTHTHSIRQFGITQLLPPNIRLISGPGCPVCVTAERDIAYAIAIAERVDIIFCCFGDMLRVPCGGKSLLSVREGGGDVRICLSPLDALKAARENPQKQIVWFGVGFETTAPLTAALIEKCAANDVQNLSVLSVHKTMPEALRSLIQEGAAIDAMLCPGHVAAVTGAEAFRFLPNEFSIPAAVSGFVAEDILLALLALVKMKSEGTASLVNAYPRAVTPNGNVTALALMNRFFVPSPSEWRGLGVIEDSGLQLRKEYEFLDAEKRFPLEPVIPPEASGCMCADILRGLKNPPDCPLFRRQCMPETPKGACMVSSEGTCAAWYQYGDDYGR